VRVAAVVVAVVVLAPAGARAAPADRGANLYAESCVGCHGPRGEGVPPPGPTRGAGDRERGGPPLRGVGARAADFYLRTGYMPLRDPYDQPRRRDPQFGEADLRALVAYVASLGGGPPVPRPDPSRGSLAEGKRLFASNCAGCHQVLGEGGVVTGAVAPPLDRSDALEIAEAVRIGPYVMPAFSTRQIDRRELDSIVRYVLDSRAPDDEGGWGIGHVGPVPEGLVTWFVALAALVAVAVALGSRARTE
jgi:quinol---cytochrome-c reductase cytochrome c subunit